MSDDKIKEAWKVLHSLGDRVSGAGAIIADAYVQAEARAKMAEHHLHCFLTSEECALCRLGLADYIKEVEAELSK